jgi:L-amino acid N-acyltransferase YncA
VPTIRDARAEDVPSLCAIYNHYVVSDVATFEEAPISSDDMLDRVQSVQEDWFWLVYEDDSGTVVGFAYASKWKARAAYRHSVETSVYVHEQHRGRRIGHALYAALLERLRARNVHSVIGGIAGQNAASTALHEAFGFRPVARFSEVGRKFGRWIDVSYYQLIVTRDGPAVTGRK